MCEGWDLLGIIISGLATNSPKLQLNSIWENFPSRLFVTIIVVCLLHSLHSPEISAVLRHSLL